MEVEVEPLLEKEGDKEEKKAQKAQETFDVKKVLKPHCGEDMFVSLRHQIVASGMECEFDVASNFSGSNDPLIRNKIWSVDPLFKQFFFGASEKWHGELSVSQLDRYTIKTPANNPVPIQIFGGPQRVVVSCQEVFRLLVQGFKRTETTSTEYSNGQVRIPKAVQMGLSQNNNLFFVKQRVTLETFNTFSYVDPNGNKVEEQVTDPHYYFFRNGAWYIVRLVAVLPAGNTWSVKAFSLESTLLRDFVPNENLYIRDSIMEFQEVISLIP